MGGACLALGPEKKGWGMEPLSLLFSYRGDESTQCTRRFALQSGARSGADLHTSPEQPLVLSDRAYEVAIQLDWQQGKMSLFVDGEQHVHDAPFLAGAPIRF